MSKLRRIILGAFAISLVLALAVGATVAALSDEETSTGNTFTAGTLDLNLDGGDTNVVAFTLGNLNPGNQPKHKYVLKNVGTVNGYLDVHDITVTDYENGCGEPETSAGDTDCGDPGEGEGELQDVLAMDLYWDNDCNGWWSTGDEYIYDGGYVGGIASDYDSNKSLPAGDSQCVVAIFNWWNTPDDNLAQSDSFTLDMTFELGETTSQ